MDADGIQHILRSLGCEKIRVHNNTVKATCPFAPYTHSKGVDRHPSFGVDINASGTSKWGCFACHNGANQTYSLIYRFKDYSGTLREDLLDYIRDREGQSLSYRLSSMTWKSSRRIENPKYTWNKIQNYQPSYDIRNYLSVISALPQYALDRGLKVKTAQDWLLGWLRVGTRLPDGYQCYNDRLFFTILNHEKKMIGWSGRLIEVNDKLPKYHHSPGLQKEEYLYGEAYIDPWQREAFVVESFMDVLNLAQFGVKNVLAIMGSHASLTQLSKLANWFDKIYVLRHADDAGELMANDIKAQLLTMGKQCEIVEPLLGRKDSGEWNFEETEQVMKSIGVWNERSETVEKTSERGQEKAVDEIIIRESEDASSTGL
jgi:5S rRNA maturation endonuclease (ribonuclease M5)